MLTMSLVRGHALVTSALLSVAMAGWVFLTWSMMDMSHPLARLMMPMSPAWGLATTASVFVMWAIMMAAMMLPSALPMVLMFAHLARRGGDRGATFAFAGAYGLMWAGFSLLAVFAHWTLQATGMISAYMISTNEMLTGALLIMAGTYQFTPMKTACLTRCRSPLSFLMSEWRRGRTGALIMGMRHGLYCIGCCWALMALLFVIGVMNLPMVAILSIMVAMEKLAPKGIWIARAAGAALLVGGAWMLIGVSGARVMHSM